LGLDSPLSIALICVLAGSVGTVGALRVRKRYWSRILNSQEMPAETIAKQKWIKGVVTSVGDGDNFRLFHTPGPFWRWPLKLRRIPSNKKDLQDATINIRLAGVDAPEAPHFGKPGQPYHKEAREWLESQLLGRRVWCKPVLRDQYQRTVAITCRPLPLIPGFLSRGRNISLMMLSAGWGVTYTSTNAEYGSSTADAFKNVEAKARNARRGMWASKVPLETPSEYKRRTASGE